MGYAFALRTLCPTHMVTATVSIFYLSTVPSDTHQDRLMFACWVVILEGTGFTLVRVCG